MKLTGKATNTHCARYAVVGQISRYVGWMNEEHRRDGGPAVGAIIARDVDRKLLLAVKANAALSLWRFDESLRLRPVG